MQTHVVSLFSSMARKTKLNEQDIESITDLKKIQDALESTTDEFRAGWFNQRPMFIVLDLARATMAFKRCLDGLPFLNETWIEVVEQMFLLIGDYEYADQCIWELIDVMRQSHEAADLKEYADRIQEAIYEFATHLMTQLDLLGIYENGQLYYVFHAMMGNEIVLRKMNIDDIPY